MTGLVLCGGESKRMGRDKGLILSGDKTWATIVAAIFQATEIPFLVSVNQNSSGAYRNYFPEQQLVIDEDSIPVRGPLAGLLTAHKHFPLEDFFVIACDMQNMNTEMIKKLSRAYHQLPGYDIYLFLKENVPEPLCSIYRSTCLAATLKKFSSGNELRYSMKSAFAEYSTCGIPLRQEEFWFFENYNSPEDLHRS